jgi:inositol transport system substrate-binding protein
MKKLLSFALVSALLSAPVSADQLKIGVTLFSFDDLFLSTLRNSIEKTGKDSGVDLQIEDAKNELGVQLNQIQNFIASGVDAIIVDTVDSDATMGMSEAAQEAGIPLVYVGRRPINVDMLPDNQAFVASNEDESGTLQTEEVCRLLGGKGNVVVMMGTLGDNAASQRTADIHRVLETPECNGLKIIEEQSADFMRTDGNDLMTNWLTAGLEFDAVIANNDEMAIGAIQALKSSGRDMDSVVIAGIDWKIWLSLHGVDTQWQKNIPKKLFTSNDYPGLVNLALEGQGILLGWHHLIEPLIKSNQLVRPLREQTIMSHNGHYLSVRNDKLENAICVAFCDWIKEKVYEQNGEQRHS